MFDGKNFSMRNILQARRNILIKGWLAIGHGNEKRLNGSLLVGFNSNLPIPHFLNYFIFVFLWLEMLDHQNPLHE